MNTTNKVENNGRTNLGYLLLLRGRDVDNGLSNEELQQYMDHFLSWSEGLAKSGKMKGGQPLAATGRMVSGDHGRVVDGPFAESKEAIGGYIHVDVDNLEEAVAIAKGCPGLKFGISIEVRPVVDECPTFKRIQDRLALATA